MDQNLVFLILAPVSMGISIFMAFISWQHRKANGAAMLSLNLLIVTGWLFFNCLEIISSTAQIALVITKIEYLFILLTPISWLAFAYEISANKRIASIKKYWWLFIIPFISFILLATNELHHLFWLSTGKAEGSLSPLSVEHGIFFYINWFYAYALILAGAWKIFTGYVNSQHVYRTHSSLVIIGVLVSILFNLVYVLKIIPGLVKDFTPISFAISGLFFGLAITRHRLFNLIPIARSILIDHLQDGLVVLDPQGLIVDINPAFVQISKMPASKLIGERLLDLLDNFQNIPIRDFKENWVGELPFSINGKTLVFEVHLRQLYDQQGITIGQLITFSDITEKKMLLETVAELASVDSLTGLVNRRYFTILANQEIQRNIRFKHPTTFIMLDLDNFKIINDSFGHQTGDWILQMVTDRIAANIRSMDVASRYGGDEFALMLPETDRENARIVAERLCESLSGTPFLTPRGEIKLSASIGVVTLQDNHGQITFNMLIDQADQAMYQAKQNGKACVFDFPVHD